MKNQGRVCLAIFYIFNFFCYIQYISPIPFLRHISSLKRQALHPTSAAPLFLPSCVFLSPTLSSRFFNTLYSTYCIRFSPSQLLYFETCWIFDYKLCSILIWKVITDEGKAKRLHKIVFLESIYTCVDT